MDVLRVATQNANRIILEKLRELPYYNDGNFRQNASSLRKFITNDFLKGNQVLAYIAKNNTIVIDENKISYQNIPVETLEMLIVHEYIHMASTNLKKQTIGFTHEALPTTYNEGLTQWLTLKLCYGDNLDNAIQTNFIYPESVKKINQLVNDIGEEVLYNHFFDADIKKNIDEMSKYKKEKWINTISELSTSYEEQLTKSSAETLENDVQQVRRQNTK